MSKNCKYMKQKINKGVWCIYNKERVSKELCSRCEYKEDRIVKKQNVINKKNKTISKLERNRFSILTNDLTVCIICGNKKEHLHEIFPGRNRSNSMKYGCVIPLCANHHREIHNNIELATYYKVVSQQRFNEVYPYLSFIGIFKKNYL